MTLGWSTDGLPAQRGTNAQRDQVRRILDIALGEGRLDDAEHARRADALPAAKTRGELADLVADLPASRGRRDWIPAARPRREDRDLALQLLGDGVAAGRLTGAEHGRRVQELVECTTYAALAKVLKGLPGWPAAEPADLLAAFDDRARLVAELRTAVADGRVGADDHDRFEKRIDRVKRVADLDSLAVELHARADDSERAAALAEIEAAYGDGRIDLEEREVRVELAVEATLDSELAGLLSDLRGRDRLPSHRERKDIAVQLKKALDEGKLDLSEYDERLEALYASTRLGRAEELLADLIDPPRPARRGPLDRIFDAVVVNSALLPEPRFWWMRWYPKVFWKVAVATVAAVWIWLIAVGGLGMAGCTLGGGWVVALLLSLGVTKLARIGAKPVKARQARLLEDLERDLREHRRGVRRVRIEVEDGAAVVVVERHDNQPRALVTEVGTEAVRRLWLSRVYPLKEITVRDHYHSGIKVEVALDRETEARLRRGYGPRPYGRLPASER